MKDVGNKLILYELNEVPIKLLKLYSQKKPNSHFAYLIRNKNLIKTNTDDIGELHPWSTWPTIHRGVNNNVHNIYFINQDLSCAKDYPPIWEKLTSIDISIGIFGSLQSYPPFINKNTKFYLPDTFAPSPDAFPKELENFQKFNLNMSKKNKAITRNIDLKNIKEFLNLIYYRQIKLNSISKVMMHIIKEKININYQKRRSLMQPIMTFDIYMEYLQKYKPSFSTYFTNHVAGMMHRYWEDLFPIDDSKTDNKTTKFNKESILKAMDIADKQLGKMLYFSKKNNYDLLVLSSMGQDYIDWGEYVPELFLDEINKTINCLGLNIRDYELLPAMQPDICIKCKDTHSKEILEERINKIKSVDGEILLPIRYKNSGSTINISIQKSPITIEKKYVFIGSRKIKLEELGIDIIKRDKGTGYHIKEGVLLFYGKNINNFLNSHKDMINTKDIHNVILDFFK